MKALLVAVVLILPATVLAHGKSHGTKPPEKVEQQSFGQAGDAKRVSREILVTMSDEMRFRPAELTVKRGETVRFRVKNNGKVMHEMVLGTMADLKAHAEMMKKHPGMEHEEPHMAHVAPGKSATMVWQFTNAGEFYFGCLVPGHFDAGMIGKVKVEP
jgi:uncharacterized cupredoxin-like copper-binding protein